MRPLVLIVHNRPGEHPSSDEADVVAQIGAAGASLERLGYSVATLGISLDLSEAREKILRQNPCCIFNLVESLDGDDRFAPAAAMLYESLHLPFTGSSSLALAVTSGKCGAKTIMHTAAIPTPLWHVFGDETARPPFFPCIIKSATDHASIGIGDGSVVNSESDWERWRTVNGGRSLRGLFAEAYINGREFNLSIIQRSCGQPQVLPCAEITFDGFPEGKPRIVGYAAKWEEETFEYQHTRRVFSSEPGDEPLREELSAIALRCWSIFSLSGYARVDFRCDAVNGALVLEINANPCLSPDAGFFAACREAGMSYDSMVQEILAAAGAPILN